MIYNKGVLHNDGNHNYGNRRQVIVARRQCFSSFQQHPQQHKKEEEDKKRLLVNNSENDEEQILRRQSRQRLAGQMNQQLQKAVSRDNRISQLEEKLAKNNDTNDNIKKELHGLLQKRETYEEQYNTTSFTQEHLEFKDMHNDAFIQLTKYCEHERQRILQSRLSSRCSLRQTTEEEDTTTATTTTTVNTARTNNTRTNATPTTTTNLFYLDGPDSRTSLAVIQKGNFTPTQCYVANRHQSSCELLRQILPETNVIHASCCEAFTITTNTNTRANNNNNSSHSSSTSTPTSSFAPIDFTSYYFDGCGGYVPHIIEMISSALVAVVKFRVDDEPEQVEGRNNNGPAVQHVSLPIILGYSLLGGAKDVSDKELQINRAITTIAHQQLTMRMIHVLEDPQKYGLSSHPTLSKISETSNTFTTWLLLEPE